MPTLAEMRAQTGPKPLPRGSRIVTLIEGQHLLAESEALRDEALDLVAQSMPDVDEDGNRTGPPKKAGQGAKDADKRAARLKEIEDAQAAMLGRLAEFQGEVGLRGITGGEWQRFKDENPPREGNAADLRLTGGNCDSSAVFSALGRFVVSWDGDDLNDGDWDAWLAERIIYADRRDLVSDIVKMHEEGLARSPKLRTGSPTTETASDD